MFTRVGADTKSLSSLMNSLSGKTAKGTGANYNKHPHACLAKQSLRAAQNGPKIPVSERHRGILRLASQPVQQNRVFTGDFRKFILRMARNPQYTSRQSPEGNHDSIEGLAKACPFMDDRNHSPELCLSFIGSLAREIWLARTQI